MFLDEPTTGLDVEARRTLWDAIRAFHADGGTVLLTSHYLEEVEALAERVVVIGRGRVLADGTLSADAGLRRPLRRERPRRRDLRDSVDGGVRDAGRVRLPVRDRRRRGRAQAWEPYTRTLSAGPLPRFVGRVLNVMALTVVSLVPVLLIAALFTEATLSPAGLLLGIGALLPASLPFTPLGLAVGYPMPQKAAIAVAQLLFFPLAFGGGLLFGVPSRLPGFLDVVAPFLPTRGAVELMWAATNDFTPKTTSMVMLGVWTVVAAGVAVWAYRRDEGRRYA